MVAQKYTKSVRLTADTNDYLVKAHADYINANGDKGTDNEVIREALKSYTRGDK